MVKAIAASKKKNDRVDARKIADLLRCDLLPECYVAPSWMQELRRVLRYRNLVVRQATRMKNRIAGLLMETGTDYKRQRLHGKGYFSKLLGSLQQTPASVQSLLQHSRGQVELFESIQDRRFLFPIRHRSEDAQATLSVLRARDSLVRARTRIINCVRGLVKPTGVRLPASNAEGFCSRVNEHIPATLRPAVALVLEEIQELTDKVAVYHQYVDPLVATRFPHARLLQQVPGVGSPRAQTAPAGPGPARRRLAKPLSLVRGRALRPSPGRPHPYRPRRAAREFRKVRTARQGKGTWRIP